MPQRGRTDTLIINIERAIRAVLWHTQGAAAVTSMAGAAAAAAAWPKAFTSAVCLIPPRAIWPRIQECRVFNDKSFTRWPPHVNL